MTERLVTVASFASPVEASLARNRLEEAGLWAVLTDELTVSMDWGLDNAVGGIKLQVAEPDAEAARSVLEAPVEDAADEPPAGPEDADEPEPVLTRREQDADRAFRGVLLGILFFPLQIYVFWLLLK